MSENCCIVTTEMCCLVKIWIAWIVGSRGPPRPRPGWILVGDRMAIVKRQYIYFSSSPIFRGERLLLEMTLATIRQVVSHIDGRTKETTAGREQPVACWVSVCRAVRHVDKAAAQEAITAQIWLRRCELGRWSRRHAGSRCPLPQSHLGSHVSSHWESVIWYFLPVWEPLTAADPSAGSVPTGSHVALRWMPVLQQGRAVANHKVPFLAAGI